jgi:hypothetical protein
VNQWGDQEMGNIPHNGPGLDPIILQQFPLLKYQKESDSNIKFQEDGLVFLHFESNVFFPC